MVDSLKKIDNFFDSQIGREFLNISERLVENDLREQAVKDILKVSYPGLPEYITYITLSGETFKATEYGDHDALFEKAVQSNLEFFKKCLAYKWGEKNE